MDWVLYPGCFCPLFGSRPHSFLRIVSVIDGGSKNLENLMRLYLMQCWLFWVALAQGSMLGILYTKKYNITDKWADTNLKAKEFVKLAHMLKKMRFGNVRHYFSYIEKHLEVKFDQWKFTWYMFISSKKFYFPISIH